ncbi:MAG: hypothetical protein Q8P18_31770 [Pseudomonadota bacterium]|nr:hypothetical protein [Pseudomonadota bacterium]
MTTDRAGGDREARERQVHASVVIAAALAWMASAGVVLHEMRQDALPPTAAAHAPPTPLASAEVADATLTDATLAAGDLRPARPRRKVVVVRRSRAS